MQSASRQGAEQPDGAGDGANAESNKPAGERSTAARTESRGERAGERSGERSGERGAERNRDSRSQRGTPPQRLRFAKMHGLGNDVMVIDLVTQRAQLTPELVRAWGDRHTGIGFDQLMVLEPPNDPVCDFALRIFNTDGSSANHCGNGVRCVGRFVAFEKLSPKRRLMLELPRGRAEVRLLGDGQVDVDMGEPVLDAAQIPFDANHARPLAPHCYVIDSACGPLELVPISMGNPHAVLFVPSVHDAEVERIGAALQEHPAFPEQVNVGFCERVDRGFLRLRVFERGVGETRACGSGACAAAVAARLVDAVNERVDIALPGGKLRVSWSGPNSVVRMSGPAALVYEGHLDL